MKKYSGNECPSTPVLDVAAITRTLRPPVGRSPERHERGRDDCFWKKNNAEQFIFLAGASGLINY